MKDSSARPAEGIETAVRTYGSILYRLCFVMLANRSDAEDAVQDTFLRYLQKAPPFRDAEHEKAWLITVAANRSRDILRSRRRQIPLDAEHLREVYAAAPDSGILESLLALPEKFRLVLTLYYVEEYTSEEIARMIGRTPSAVKMRLKKGRTLLEEQYRKECL